MTTPNAMPRRAPASQQPRTPSEGLGLPRPKRRRRKRKQPPSPLCGREGCTRPRDGSRDYCTLTCFALAADLAKAERLCRRAGTSPQTTELWVIATELGDLLSRYLELSAEVRALVEDGQADAGGGPRHPRGGNPPAPILTGT